MIQLLTFAVVSLDVVVIFTFAVFLPISAKLNYDRLRRRLDEGVPGARARQYRISIGRQWVLTAIAVIAWFYPGRSAEDLGLGGPTFPGFAIVLALAIALAWLWRSQVRAALQDDTARQVLRRRLEEVAPLLPETEEELALFSRLSVTAGVCEEILFRGYWIGSLAPAIGTPAAAITSGVVFGAGHLYQGPRQAFKIVFVGWLFAGLYLGSGSLWVPMGLHALLDFAQGRLAFSVRGSSSVDDPAGDVTKP